MWCSILVVIFYIVGRSIVVVFYIVGRSMLVMVFYNVGRSMVVIIFHDVVFHVGGNILYCGFHGGDNIP